MTVAGRVFALIMTVAVLTGMAGAAGAQGAPGNAGNLDDGGPVDRADVLALRDANRDWIPTPGEALVADCEATTDPPQLHEQNGIVLIRAWGHWNCNQPLPGSYLEVCLDMALPSVSCNEKFVPPPRTSISIPVDFPCVPGVYVTMASGTNPFDTNRSNDVAHSPYALMVWPADCKYLQATP